MHMKKLLLAGSSIFLLNAGVAFANPPGPGPDGGGSSTVVTVPVVKNAGSIGSGTNSSATTGGTAVSAALTNSANTTSSNNTANSDNLSVLKVIGSNYAASGSMLSTTNTHTHVDITLASAVSNGSISDNETNLKPCLSKISSNASMSNVNGGTGILAAQQNTGANSLQENTVALGSAIQGSNNLLP
jgi:hypothetical protein